MFVPTSLLKALSHVPFSIAKTYMDIRNMANPIHDTQINANTPTTGGTMPKNNLNKDVIPSPSSEVGNPTTTDTQHQDGGAQEYQKVEMHDSENQQDVSLTNSRVHLGLQP
mmetsp:Transcript_16688/g.25544  ORF Transcript_16688/g.25544 Transcript_16688/m.25544 type:complete len:111 (-) Transcript_16688:248-580(-)